MSLKTWKQEFYPITAKNAVRKFKLNTVKLVEHSIQKWVGLRESNLEKHEMVSQGFWHNIQEQNDAHEFQIDIESCALCVKFYLNDTDDCLGCPLFEVLGARCDKIGNPYHKWITYDDPTEMIKSLRKAKKWAEKNS